MGVINRKSMKQEKNKHAVTDLDCCRYESEGFKHAVFEKIYAPCEIR